MFTFFVYFVLYESPSRTRLLILYTFTHYLLPLTHYCFFLILSFPYILATHPSLLLFSTLPLIYSFTSYPPLLSPYFLLPSLFGSLLRGQALTIDNLLRDCSLSLAVHIFVSHIFNSQHKFSGEQICASYSILEFHAFF